MQNGIIRIAEDRDWRRLKEIATECFGEEDGGESFEETARNNPYGTVWLMEDGKGDILSFFLIVAEEIAYNWYAISWVSTPVKHRGNGYATLLLSYSLERIGETICENEKDFNYDVVVQLCCKDNLLDLYKRVGFQKVWRTHDHYNLMVKEFIYLAKK